MIDDDNLAIPAFLRRTPERQAEIDASWKGKRLVSVSSASFKVEKQVQKPTDPGTLQLLRELEAARKAAAKQAKLDRKEKAIIRQRQKGKRHHD